MAGKRFIDAERRSPEALAWHRLYNSKRWRAYRDQQLRKEPLCAFCAKDGRVTAATVADHRIPHKGDLNLFWDAENLQSLCGPCHSGRKLAIEKRGYDNAIGEDGFPTDPNHPWLKGRT